MSGPITIVVGQYEKNMEKNYFDLTERVALITGCSSGLGVQMAKALASQGCNIVAVARRKNLIDEVAKEIMANCKRTEDYKDRFDSIIE